MLRLQQCEEKISSTLGSVRSLNVHLGTLAEATDRVREQSNRLSSNASSLLARKSLLEAQCESLTAMLRRFQHIEAVCKESSHPMLVASSSRFPALMEEIDSAVAFLIANVDMRSSRQFLTLVASAQTSTTQVLRAALTGCFDSATAAILSDVQYAACFIDKANLPFKGVHNLMGVPTMDEDGLMPAVFQGHLAALNEAFRRHADEHSGTALRRLLEDRSSRCRSSSHQEVQGDRDRVETELAQGAQLADRAVVEETMAAFRRSRMCILEPLFKDHLSTATKITLSANVDRLLGLVRDVWEEEQLLFKNMWITEDGPLVDHGLKKLEEDLCDFAYQQYRRCLVGTDDLDELGRAHAAILAASSSTGATLVPTHIKRMIGDTQERAVNRATVFLRGALQSNTKEDTATLFRTGAEGEGEGLLPAVVLRATSFLDTLYPMMDRSVFTIFADECLRVTLAAVVRVTKEMGLSTLPPNVAAGSGPIHALLLRLCSLLRLREHLSSYDSTFTVIEQRLDLSHLAQTKLGITQTSRDAKRDVEAVLKECCDALIDRISISVCPPSGPEVAESDVKEAYASAEALLCRYILSSATRAVLLRPIRSHVSSNFETRSMKNGIASPTPLTWE